MTSIVAPRPVCLKTWPLPRSLPMIANLLDEGTPCAFVLADAIYGSDFRFRRMLEAREQPYVLAVRSTHNLRLNWPPFRPDTQA